MRNKNKEKGFLGLEKGSFAEGLAMFNTKGSIVSPVRLNKRMKEIIFILINESKSDTTVKFEDQEDRLDDFLEAMKWLENQITSDKLFKIRLSKRIGWIITMWMTDQKYHYLSDEPDFDKATQWIANKINSKYSLSELSQWK
jgi:flavodoxin